MELSELRQKPHLSASTLTTYIDCSLQYFFSRVKRLPMEFVSDALSFGTVIHLPGDCNLWYLGCCEKFGHLIVGDDSWQWGMGESSFDTVEAFVRRLHELELTTLEQHQALMEKIEEGRQFDCMYQIWRYLDAKDHGLPWIKEPDPRSCRREIKTMLADVKESLAKEGYEVLIP